MMRFSAIGATLLYTERLCCQTTNGCTSEGKGSCSSDMYWFCCLWIESARPLRLVWWCIAVWLFARTLKPVIISVNNLPGISVSVKLVWFISVKFELQLTDISLLDWATLLRGFWQTSFSWQHSNPQNQSLPAESFLSHGIHSDMLSAYRKARFRLLAPEVAVCNIVLCSASPDWIRLCSVLRPLQHSTGYMGDGFYRLKDPTNSIKVLKEMLQRKTKTTQRT